MINRIVKIFIATAIIIVVGWFFIANYFLNSSCYEIKSITDSEQKTQYLLKWAKESFINSVLLEWFSSYRGIKVDLPFIINSLGDEWKLDLEYLGLDVSSTKVEVNFGSNEEISTISIGSKGSFLTIFKEGMAYNLSYICSSIGEADHR